MSVEEAYKLYKSKNPDKKVCYIGEIPDRFIIACEGNGSINGYDTINKKTGELGIIWMIDFFDYVDSGKLKDIDLKEIKGL